MKANLVENQARWTQFWTEEKIYERRLQQNCNKPLFLVIDGPPYANGAIHMGHALNKVLKDFIIRWKNISGFKSPFLPGWDVHGLPIEHKVETETKDFKSLSLVEKRAKALNFAQSQLKLQLAQLKKLHLFHPLNEHYSTADSSFIAGEYSLFLHLWKEELIIREYKPVAWSYSSQTALAESEIEYEEEECESIFFCWKIVETSNPKLLGVNLILWTTTPYSLESNLAVAFHTELKYFLAKGPRGEHYLASENFFSREGDSFEIIQELSSAELLMAKYLNNLTGEVNPILSANFVLENRGSGFVHLAPGLGHEDYLVCKKHNILPYCSIDNKGFFKKETKFSEISQKFYKDASRVVIDFLNNSNSLFKLELIKHRVGKDWRTKKPILFRATEQWFLNLKKLKSELNNAFENNVFSQPNWLFKKLKETVLSREEWCISRQRAWGLPIPIIFKNGKEYGGLAQLQKNISILLSEGIDSWYTKPITYFVGEQDKLEEFSKSFDVLDVWFDSGSVFMGQKECINSSVIYLEGGDQLRGWFNSSSILSVAKNNSLPFTHLISHGFVLDSAKEKMSKSKGNVINPVELVDEFGTDIFRLWIASVNYFKDISFGREKLIATQQDYKRIRNILFRFSLGIIGENTWTEIQLVDYDWTFQEHEYMYYLFLNFLHSSENELNSFNFYRVVSQLKEFLELYSSWYLELVKPALYSRDSKNLYRQEAVIVISVVFKYSLLLCSIFIPQTAEEIYQFLKAPNKYSSIWLEDWHSSNYQVLLKRFELKNLSHKWAYFFTLRNKVLDKLDTQIKEKYQILKEQKLYLPSSEIKHFSLEELTRLLMVAELIESNSQEIIFEPTVKSKCQRCFCFFETSQLKSEAFEAQEYLLCNLCTIALQEYREDNKWNNEIANN